MEKHAKNPKGIVSVPENEAKVKWLVERLLDVPATDVVTYEDLRKAAGCDVRFRYRYLLEKARRRLKREHQILFVAVINQGLKRCDDLGVVEQGDRRLTLVRRQARRGAEEVACVQSFEGLSPEDRHRLLAQMSYFMVVNNALKPARVRQIEGRMANRIKELPWKEMLDGLKDTIELSTDKVKKAQ